MKQQISPAVAVVVILAVLGIVAFAWIKFSSGGAGSLSGQKPPGMPPEAAAQLQQIMGGATGRTAPSAPSGPGLVLPSGTGGMTAPPTPGR
jgi:hypothetical protein